MASFGYGDKRPKTTIFLSSECFVSDQMFFRLATCKRCVFFLKFVVNVNPFKFVCCPDISLGHSLAWVLCHFCSGRARPWNYKFFFNCGLIFCLISLKKFKPVILSIVRGLFNGFQRGIKIFFHSGLIPFSFFTLKSKKNCKSTSYLGSFDNKTG